MIVPAPWEAVGAVAGVIAVGVAVLQWMFPRGKKPQLPEKISEQEPNLATGSVNLCNSHNEGPVAGRDVNIIHPPSIAPKLEHGGSPRFYMAIEGSSGSSEHRPDGITGHMILFRNMADSTGHFPGLSPVDFSFILRVMNTGDKAVGINRYEAEAQTLKGRWEPTYAPSSLQYDAVLPSAELDQAHLFDLDRCGFDRKLGRVIIKPGDGIRGWVFFEFSKGSWNDYVGAGHPLTIRMTVHTLDGKSFTGDVNHVPFNQFLITENTIYFPNTFDLRKAKILPALPGRVRKPMDG